MPSLRLRDLALIAVPFLVINLWSVLRTDELPVPDGPRVLAFRTGPWDALRADGFPGDPGRVRRVVLRFDRPMVHGDRLGRTSHAGEMTLDPPVDGTLVWDDDRTVIFEAQAPLPPATAFTVSLRDDLTDRTVTPVVGKRRWRFVTGELTVHDVRARGFDAAGRPSFEIRFSLPVRPADFAAHIIVRQGGTALPYRVRELAPDRHVRFRLTEEAAGDIEIRVDAALVPADGERPLGETVRHTVTAREQLSPWVRGPKREGPDRVSMTYHFGRKVARAELLRCLEIDPAVEVTIEGGGSTHRIVGDFRRGRRYVITLRKGLRGGPAVLRADDRRVFHPPDRDRMIRLSTRGGRYLCGPGARAVELHTVNLPEVVVTVDRVEPANVVHRVTGVARYDELTTRLMRRTIPLHGRLDEDLVTRIDLAKLLGEEARGILRLTVSEENSWRRERTDVVVSDLGLTLDLGERQAGVGVLSLASARPVRGVHLKLLDALGIGVAEGITGADGTAILLRSRWAPGRSPVVLVAEKGDDASYLSLEEARVGRKGLPVGGRPWLDALAASVHVDRGIVRPGESVRVKAFLRAPGVVVPEDVPVGLRLVRPDGRPLAETVVRSGDAGSVAAELTTPDWGPTGPWRIEVGIPGGARLGSEPFRVEDFLPDRMRVNATAPEGPLGAGGALDLTVSASMLAGPPASGAPMSGSVRGVPVPFQPEGADGFRFGDDEDPGDRFTLPIPETTLDGAGGSTVSIPMPGSSGSRPYRVTATVSVREPGGRAVSAHLVRDLHAHAAYLGLRDAGRAADGTRRVEVVARRPDGSPADLAEVRLTLHSVLWTSWWERRRDGSWRYQRDRDLARLSEVVVVLEGGLGAVDLRLPDDRDVLVRATADAAGASTWLLENAQDRPAARPTHLDLTLDRSSYRPGDEVLVHVISPHAGRLSWQLQDADVLTRGEEDLESPSGAIRFRIPETDAPNLHLVATVLRVVSPGDVGVPRAEGVLPIPLHADVLTLETGMPDEIRAGSNLAVTVIARGPDGPLANADLCIALVDEGILALTGHEARDPGDVFLARRRCGTVRYDLYGRLLPSLANPEDSDTGGGAGEKGALADRDEALRLNPVRARRVDPLVDWRPAVVTGAEGRATVWFQLPDRTGAARVTVLAAHGRLFGHDARTVRLTRPLDVHASLPRFLAPGDEVEVPIEVTNSTGRPGEVRVVVAVDGPVTVVREPEPVRIDPAGRAVTMVRLRAGAAGVVRIEVRAALGSEIAVQSTEIPVRPAAPRTRRGGTVRLVPGKEIVIDDDAAWLEGTRRAEILVSRSPLARLSGGLDHLLRYPYGCCEQTVSAVFPLLYLGDVARAGDVTLDEARITNLVQVGIDRVLSMQTAEGGMTLWPSGRRHHGWASCYAAHFLLEARRAGFDVPKDDLRRLLDWLPGAQGATGNVSGVGAYAVYVRAFAGRRDVSTLDRLAQCASGMRPWERELLLAAGARVGTLEKLDPRDVEAAPVAAAPMDSDTRALAIRLLALLDRSPDDPRVPALVDELFARQVNGRWGTTQENAFALLALGKACAAPTGEGVGTVDGEEITLVGSAVVRIPATDGPVRIDWTGPGHAWVSWHVDGVRTDGPPPEEDRGLRVRRRYVDLDGHERDVKTFRRGELIVVELTLSASRKTADLVLVDPLPACLEIENPAIRTRVGVAGLVRDRIDVDRFEIRDDRYLLFASLPGDDAVRTWRYLTRCTAAGTFAVPPVSLEAMYDPRLRSLSGTGTCEVSP